MIAELMSTRLVSTLGTILTAILVVGLLHVDAAEAQPGAHPPPPAQPAPYYGGNYPPAPNLHLLTPEERKILWQGEISPGQTIGGGLLAAWLGFGIGHAVQGRYEDTGWMFTAGEAAAIAVAVYGAVQLSESYNYDRRNQGGETLLVGGLLSFGVLRIWEIVDALVAPGNHNRRYRAVKWKVHGGGPAPRYGLYITPGGTQGGGTAGLALRF